MHCSISGISITATQSSRLQQRGCQSGPPVVQPYHRQGIRKKSTGRNGRQQIVTAIFQALHSRLCSALHPCVSDLHRGAWRLELRPPQLQRIQHCFRSRQVSLGPRPLKEALYFAMHVFEKMKMCCGKKVKCTLASQEIRASNHHSVDDNVLLELHTHILEKYSDNEVCVQCVRECRAVTWLQLQAVDASKHE